MIQLVNVYFLQHFLRGKKGPYHSQKANSAPIAMGEKA